MSALTAQAPFEAAAAGHAVDGALVRRVLDACFTHWERLEERRAQTGTHTPPFLIAPYYVFFGHHYAAQAIEQLPPAERPEYRSRLHERLAQVRDADGTWNDRVFPRSANDGTAMVVLALGMPGALGPATWDDGASRPDPVPTK
jgi:hypothetical protein